MGEIVEYSGLAHGFATTYEQDEFVELTQAFQEAFVDVVHETEAVQFWVTNGRRSSGRSCEEIVAGHFGEWLDDKLHVSIEVWATFVEHAPREQVFEHGGKA